MCGLLVLLLLLLLLLVVIAYFFGASAQLVNDDIVHTGDDRFRMKTLSGGSVVIRLQIIAKDFQRHGVLLGSTS